jgi:hypothetical protein
MTLVYQRGLRRLTKSYSDLRLSTGLLNDGLRDWEPVATLAMRNARTPAAANIHHSNSIR